MTDSGPGAYARQGISAALISAVLLGLTPIFGKQALRAGMDPLALVVLRTCFAAAALWITFAVYSRRYIFIYPAGLIACATAGFINGAGSLLYYVGLAYLDASLAQLLYTVHPILLALLLRLDGQRLSRLTLFRMALAVPAVAYLLAQGGQHANQTRGMLLMVGAGFLYAMHLAVTQRALRDMPSQTVTLYTVTAMAVTVLPSAIWIRAPVTQTPAIAWVGVAGLTIVTVLSRLSLFVGVKQVGGLQTALVGLSELLVSVIMAHLLFGDQLTPGQWIGAGALVISVALVSREKDLTAHRISEGWIAWVYGLLEKLQPQPEAPPLAQVPSQKAAGDD